MTGNNGTMKKTPLSWQGDEHGTLCLHPDGPGGGFAWIQARRPYCDRGHWDWGSQGIEVDATHVRAPSYYFMHLDNAIAEVESWLLALRGQPTASEPIDETVDERVRGTGWERVDDRLEAIVPGPDGLVNARITAGQDRAGTVFELAIDGIASLDDSDRFPRHYRNLDVALTEANDFLAWRLTEIPADKPRSLHDYSRPVGQELGQVLGKPARRPRASRH